MNFSFNEPKNQTLVNVMIKPYKIYNSKNTHNNRYQTDQYLRRKKIKIPCRKDPEQHLLVRKGKLVLEGAEEEKKTGDQAKK